MIVKLFDGRELIVSTEGGQALKTLLLTNKHKMVDINDEVINTSSIAYMRPGGITEPDLPPAPRDSKQIGGGDPQRAYDVARKKAAEVRAKLIKKGVIKK